MAISQEKCQPPGMKIILKITYLKLYSNPLGINELKSAISHLQN